MAQLSLELSQSSARSPRSYSTATSCESTEVTPTMPGEQPIGASTDLFRRNERSGLRCHPRFRIRDRQPDHFRPGGRQRSRRPPVGLGRERSCAQARSLSAMTGSSRTSECLCPFPVRGEPTVDLARTAVASRAMRALTWSSRGWWKRHRPRQGRRDAARNGETHSTISSDRGGRLIDKPSVPCVALPRQLAPEPSDA